jgi:hypothetical protein
MVPTLLAYGFIFYAIVGRRTTFSVSLQLVKGALQRYKARIQNPQPAENILAYLQLVSFEGADPVAPSGYRRKAARPLTAADPRQAQNYRACCLS